MDKTIETVHYLSDWFHFHTYFCKYLCCIKLGFKM